MSHTEAPSIVLVYLAGSRRGEVVTISGDEIRLGTDFAMDIRLPADIQPLPAPHHATLRRRGSSYELDVQPDQLVWVNGEQVDRLVLASGDVLEVGGDGAVLRFRIYPPGVRPRRTAVEVFSDCIECAVRGADGLAGQAGVLVKSLPRDMVTRTSHVFRIGLTAVLIALAGSTWALARRSTALEDRLARLTREAGITELLERAEPERMNPEDFSQVLAELEAGLASATRRLETIEGQVGEVGSVVRTAAEATVFVQGAYGFRDPSSGRMIRLTLDRGGRPIRRPGRPQMLTTEGDGPVLEVFYTGTGFVASPDGLVLTNRHVALPWEFDESARRLIDGGLEPVMLRFIGYLPGEPEPFDVSVVARSDEADLAVLRCSVAAQVPFLEVSGRTPEPGDAVIVMGYPLGIRALMARADRDFVQHQQSRGGGDFWSVAEDLSRSGYIAPLATRGIVGQRTGQFVVYDAETTSGGSGGPVLGLDGLVVAVNAAILPEFGGSNLGVPAARARALLEQVRGRGSRRRSTGSHAVLR